MPGAPVNMHEFLDLVRKSGVVDVARLDAHVQKLQSEGLLPPEPPKIAGVLIRDGFLTHFHAENILQGKWRRFSIGRYKVLEKIGSGGMGQVYLCEHKVMRRRVAIKVLPTAKAEDDAALERFYREARAVAALDHPNIVHAYDIDQDEKLHFLVMEYVDGASLQEIVKKSGPLAVSRACHYIRQAALGLQHAHEQANLVHRDIKPGNIMVDRCGAVKVLDMGLARFFNDEEDMLTKKFDDLNMGTLDYQAPEQAIDSHNVDIRADIYSLGATFFFVLTGKTLFDEGTPTQKAMWHQTRPPKLLAEFRKDIPPGLQDILSKMLAKEKGQRFAEPAQVAAALVPFTQLSIDAPPDSEMPHLSPAASGAGPQDGVGNPSVTQGASSRAPLRYAASASSGLDLTSVPTSPVPNRPAARPAANGAVALKTAPRPSVQSGRAAAKQQVAVMPRNPKQQNLAENMASETQHTAAKDDTAPQPLRRLQLDRSEESAKRKTRWRLWGVIGALYVVLLSTVAILLWQRLTGP
jgi:serine/threonine protein kinase